MNSVETSEKKIFVPKCNSTRRKSMDIANLGKYPETNGYAISQVIEKLKKEMPEFDTLSEQIRYLNESLIKALGPKDTKKALLFVFPFEKVSNIDYYLKEKSVGKDNGRPLGITKEEQQIIIKMCYDSFENENPLTINDLFCAVSPMIKSSGFTLEYLRNHIQNHKDIFTLYETECLDKKRTTISEESISNYFKKMNKCIEGVSPHLVCNIDEIGFGEIHSGSKVYIVDQM